MERRYGAWIVLMFLSLISIAAVNKKEDPILDTQTNPILYEDKMKEVKDGQKEAPKPSYKFYPKDTFLSESNINKSKEEEETSSDQIPKAGEPIPENLGPDVASDSDQADLPWPATEEDPERESWDNEDDASGSDVSAQDSEEDSDFEHEDGTSGEEWGSDSEDEPQEDAAGWDDLGPDTESGDEGQEAQ